MDITNKTITNWAKTYKYRSQIVTPNNKFELIKTINSLNKRKIKFSIMSSNMNYTDQIFCKRGCIVDIKNINKIIKINTEKDPYIIVEAACTFKKLLNNILPLNFTIGAIAGSDTISISGALTNLVHGKDSNEFGCFINNVIEIEILKTNGEICILKKSDIPMIHNFGIFYIVINIKLKLLPIKNNYIQAKTYSFDSNNKFFKLIRKIEGDYIYGWLDLLSSETKGYFEVGNFTSNKNEKNLSKNYLLFSRYILDKFSFLIKFFFNKNILKFINILIYRIASKEKERIIYLYDFYFPLKYIPFEKFFKNGVVEIQLLIPMKNFDKEFINLKKILQKFKIYSFITGIKFQIDQSVKLSMYKKGVSISIVFPKAITSSNNFYLFKETLVKLIKNKTIFINLTKDIISSENIIDKKDKEIFLEKKKFFDKDNLLISDFTERFHLVEK